MELCNCMKCNKIFNHMSGPTLCRECDKIVFDKIKEYLEYNPSATSKEINKDTNIPIRIIMEYIKDKRITEIRENLNLCVLCGEVIDDGLKYCIDCSKKRNVTDELKNMYKEIKCDKPKMHFLNSNRKNR